MTTLPVNEIFCSIQGEGSMAEVPMIFLRLAGCNVGRYLPLAVQELADSGYKLSEGEKEVISTEGKISKPRFSTCTSFTGEKFVCDTDYRAGERMTDIEIFDSIMRFKPVRVSITGGEPFIHKFADLAEMLADSFYWVSVETSGTIPLKDRSEREFLSNIVCSPKAGFVEDNAPFINEFKLIVNTTDDLLDALKFWEKFKDKTIGARWFLQPVNPISTVSENQDFLRFVSEFACVHTQFEISMQIHKLLGVR